MKGLHYFKTLISTTIHDRKQCQRNGETSFDSEYINAFNAKLEELLA